MQIQPIYSFSDDALTRVLSGRGTIWEIQCTLRIASLMMASFNTDQKLRGTRSTDFCQLLSRLGCNGFVGAYLREIAGAHPGTGSLTCKTLASGPKRSSVEEIRERDFIFHNGSPDHIQIIGQIRQIDDSGYLYCNICEARSPKLMGPQTLTWKIKRDGSKWKMYRTAEGSTNAIGAVVHRDWVSRNAMVG